MLEVKCLPKAHARSITVFTFWIVILLERVVELRV